MGKTIQMFDGVDVTLEVSHYVSDPMVMAITTYDAFDGTPYAVLTANLGNDIGNGSFMQYGASFANSGYGVDMVDEIVNAGLGKPYTRFGEPVVGYSGYNEYTLIEFDMDKLAELDPKGVAEYRDAWARGLADAQQARSASFGQDYATGVSAGDDGLGF